MSKILIDTDEYFDTTEAAKLLGIGYATLYRWIKSGKILPLRVAGRTVIPKSEIDRLKAMRRNGRTVISHKLKLKRENK